MDLKMQYKGYTIKQAAYQPSKGARSGLAAQRSIQVMSRGMILKSIRYKVAEEGGFVRAVNKAKSWVDRKEVPDGV